MKILKKECPNDLYENFEKRGSREKGRGGNEINAPCACDYNRKV